MFWSKIEISRTLSKRRFSERGIVNLINFDEMMKFNRSLRRIDVNARLFPRLRRFLSREACCIFVVKLLSTKSRRGSMILNSSLKFVSHAPNRFFFLSFNSINFSIRPICSTKIRNFFSLNQL